METEPLAGVVVLVVEDHLDLRYLLRVWLERAGALVREASDGHEALLALATRPQIDVIVCDLHMPGMDGCAFVSRLRKNAGFGHIPVVALTGSESDRALVRSLEAGFNAHLVKPVTGESLRAQIQQILNPLPSTAG